MIILTNMQRQILQYQILQFSPSNGQAKTTVFNPRHLFLTRQIYWSLDLNRSEDNDNVSTPISSAHGVYHNAGGFPNFVPFSSSTCTSFWPFYQGSYRSLRRDSTFQRGGYRRYINQDCGIPDVRTYSKRAMIVHLRLSASGYTRERWP